MLETINLEVSYMKHTQSSAAVFASSVSFSPRRPIQKEGIFRCFKDPGSAITHLIAFLLTLIAGSVLVSLSIKQHDPLLTIAMGIFSLSMAGLYAASTCYHTFDTSESANTLRKKIDHMMIFVLIAGSYTPICLFPLRERGGLPMLAIVWGIALLGCILKLFWVYCPKWVSSILYISMGWLCIFSLPQLLDTLSASQFAWLLAGGIIYTIGGVIYALKLPLFNHRHPSFGSHEIFHLFVMGGSFCHVVVMFLLL